MNSFVVALKEKFADVFGKLGDIVQKKDCSVGKITISLIRQSVREGKPRAVIEAFDRTGADKKRLYTDDMDISWLFSTWQTYREMLEKKAEEEQKNISEESSEAADVIPYHKSDIYYMVYGKRNHQPYNGVVSRHQDSSFRCR